LSQIGKQPLSASASINNKGRTTLTDAVGIAIPQYAVKSMKQAMSYREISTGIFGTLIGEIDAWIGLNRWR
jgi:hypothetical protein